MKSDSDSTPLDINELTSLVKSLRKQVSHQSIFIDQLLEQIKLARHHRFGAKSEHISPDQLRLLLEGEQAQKQTEPKDEPDEPAEPEATSKRHKPGRR